MRLASFTAMGSNETRIGAVFDDEKESLLDLNAAYCLYLIEKAGEEQPVRVADGVLPSDMIKFFEMGKKGMDRASEAIDFIRAKTGAVKSLDPIGRRILYKASEVKLKPPVPNPPAMFWLMFTFQGTMEEVGPKSVQVLPLCPVIPAWFFKPIQCLVGPDDYVIRPTNCEAMMQSTELGIVIGRRAFRISKEEVYDYIAGYTMCKDVTALDFLPKEQLTWTMIRCKVFPTFAPMGPYIVTKDAVPDPHNLTIEEYVDEELRMSTNTAQYETKFEDVVVHAAMHVPLEVGTTIAMGGPPGCTSQHFSPGQTMISRMDKVGLIKNPVISEEEAIAKGLIPKKYNWPGEKDYELYLNNPAIKDWALRAMAAPRGGALG
jgi:acylpyruvate hydrolase